MRSMFQRIVLNSVKIRVILTLVLNRVRLTGNVAVPPYLVQLYQYSITFYVAAPNYTIRYYIIIRWFSGERTILLRYKEETSWKASPSG